MNSNWDKNNLHIILYGDPYPESTHNEHYICFDIADTLANQLALQFRTISLAYETADPMNTVKNYRYIAQNKSRIESILNNENVLGLGFSSHGADDFIVLDAVCSLHFRYGLRILREPSMIFDVMIDLEKLQNEVPLQNIREFFHNVIQRIEGTYDVQYGLVQILPKKALGVAFFQESLTPNLTGTEEANFKCWKEQRETYQEKIRDVYWGNLITDKHLGDRPEYLLNKIRKIVGDTNCTAIDKGKYLMFLPMNADEYAHWRAHVSAPRSALLDLLKEHDRLMCPSY